MHEKKYLIILILKVLENESDSKHPLRQSEIAKAISDVFPCDRKTIGRNIKYLQKVGYPILKTSKGFYMENRIFMVEEKDFILNAVRSAPGKTEAEKESIANRLIPLLAKIRR